MPTITINDLTIYYEISGDGPPLVLLPGLLGTIESDWRRFVPSLSERFQTIAVDLRGHGRTNNPDPATLGWPGELEMKQLTDDLNGLIDSLGFESVSVLGYSLGGCVGLAAGLKQPGHIQALIMHATKFFWDVRSIETMTAGFDPEAILQKSPRYAQSLQNNHSAVYGEDYWKMLLKTAAGFVKTMPATAPALEQAATAAFPILVSVGDHDQLVGLDEADRLFRALPKGQLLVLPDTRHPLKSVRTEVFWPVVVDFLERAHQTDKG